MRELPGVHAQFDDLQGDAAAHRFLLLRQIDDPAPAFADLLKQAVSADGVPWFFQHRDPAKTGRIGRRRSFPGIVKKSPGPVMRFQQIKHPPMPHRIPPACILQEADPLRRILKIEGRVKRGCGEKDPVPSKGGA